MCVGQRRGSLERRNEWKVAAARAQPCKDKHAILDVSAQTIIITGREARVWRLRCFCLKTKLPERSHGCTEAQKEHGIRGTKIGRERVNTMESGMMMQNARLSTFTKLKVRDEES